MKKKVRPSLNENEQVVYDSVREAIQDRRKTLYSLDEGSKERRKAFRAYQRFATKEVFKMHLKFIQMNKLRGLRMLLTDFTYFIWTWFVVTESKKHSVLFENILFVFYNLCAVLGIAMLVLLVFKKVTFNF